MPHSIGMVIDLHCLFYSFYTIIIYGLFKRGRSAPVQPALSTGS